MRAPSAPANSSTRPTAAPPGSSWGATEGVVWTEDLAPEMIRDGFPRIRIRDIGAFSTLGSVSESIGFNEVDRRVVRFQDLAGQVPAVCAQLALSQRERADAASYVRVMTAWMSGYHAWQTGTQRYRNAPRSCRPRARATSAKFPGVRRPPS
ncbi:hypothetical protein ABT116_32040 [Streptomyces sp. NPDC002130]|uniref:hypothetical protein n=1 Tax=Streptomyces sp. NPDC002130 TaxID=3155568 RepID=UPI00332BD86E